MDATKGKSNFSAGDLYCAYLRLEKMFGTGKVLFIGGRAVNLICEMNQRPTHDIDVAVSVPKDKIEDIKRKAIENGFIVPKGEGSKVNKLELMISGNTLMQIDLYYDRPISGIPIWYLFETSTEIKKSQSNKTYKFKVVNPGVLTVLKFFAYTEADKNSIEKHERDIKLLLDTYNGIDNFFSKFGDVIKRLFSDQNYVLFKENITNIYRPIDRMLRVR